MKRIPLLACLLALVLAFSPAMAQNNSLADVVRAAQTKPLVVDGLGDSTYGRTGAGHGQAIGLVFASLVESKGMLSAPNHTAAFSDTHSQSQYRRRLNGTTYIGPMVPQTFGKPGIPVSELQYGFSVPMVGLDGGFTTTITTSGGINSSAVSFNVANRDVLFDPDDALTHYLKVDDELIAYTNIAGAGAGSITITQRGALGTRAVAHAENAVIRAVIAWEGPVTQYQPIATLTSAITDAAYTGTFTVDSTDAFPASGFLRLPAGECISYTIVDSTTFDITARDQIPADPGALGGLAIGQRVAWHPGNSNLLHLAHNDHPFGVNAAMKGVMFFKHNFATSLAQAVYTPEIATSASWDTSVISFSSLGIGTATNVTGQPLGTFGKAVVTVAAAGTDRGAVYLNWGPNRSGTYYLMAGGAYMFSGLIATDRPAGVVNVMGTSRGGFTLNTFYRTMDRYDSVAGLNLLRVGMVERYKLYHSVGDADIGGSDEAALAHFTGFGHNETGSFGKGYTSPYIKGYEWTASDTATSGKSSVLAADYTSSDTTIDVLNGAGLKATKGMIHVESSLGEEYITYEVATLVSGTQYQLTGCMRGMFGTVPIGLDAYSPVRQGYLNCNPKGFAADVLFDYLFRRDCWIDAGNDIEDFHYIFYRPIPTSASPEFVAEDAAAASGNDAQREYKLRQFMTAVQTYCGSLPQFVALDLLEVIGGDESIVNDNGAATNDNTHHARSAYLKYWSRIFAHFAYGQGAGSNPVPGVDGVVHSRGGPRGRPRRVVKGVRRRPGRAVA